MEGKNTFHILLVEDDWQFYHDLSTLLIANNYTVAGYTKRYEEALKVFKTSSPDAILMDIELEGALNGIQLAEEIRKNSDIPIVYISDNHGNEILEKALSTHPNNFLVKSKVADKEQILITLKTALQKRELTDVKKVEEPNYKYGVMGLVEYKEKIKSKGTNFINAVPVAFEDILFFSLNDFENENGNQESLKVNYLWFLARVKSKNGAMEKTEMYFLETSMSKLYRELPYYFARIDQYNIVNLKPYLLRGRINGHSLQLGNKIFKITNTYREEVQDKINKLYLEM